MKPHVCTDHRAKALIKPLNTAVLCMLCFAVTALVGLGSPAGEEPPAPEPTPQVTAAPSLVRFGPWQLEAGQQVRPGHWQDVSLSPALEPRAKLSAKTLKRQGDELILEGDVRLFTAAQPWRLIAPRAIASLSYPTVTFVTVENEPARQILHKLKLTLRAESISVTFKPNAQLDLSLSEVHAGDFSH